jgi:rod shape-determining protein MreC
VLAVSSGTSIVLLVADPTSGVGVRDVRSGALLLATGHGAKGLVAAPLEDAADVKAGDVLDTGPAGDSTYVSPIEVGTVTRVGRDAQGNVMAQVRPRSSQTGLDLLGVVMLPPRTVARPALTSGSG